MSHDFARPDRDDADAIIFAAGHGLGFMRCRALRRDHAHHRAGVASACPDQLRLETSSDFAAIPPTDAHLQCFGSGAR
jgi:hypothetical protein